MTSGFYLSDINTPPAPDVPRTWKSEYDHHRDVALPPAFAYREELHLSKLSYHYTNKKTTKDNDRDGSIITLRPATAELSTA